MNKFLIVAMAILISGCARESMRGDFGYSTENNIAAQTINPEAATTDRGVIGTHGAKINMGVERYLKDDGTVEEGRIVEDISN